MIKKRAHITRNLLLFRLSLWVFQEIVEALPLSEEHVDCISLIIVYRRNWKVSLDGRTHFNFRDGPLNLFVHEGVDHGVHCEGLGMEEIYKYFTLVNETHSFHWVLEVIVWSC